MFNFSIIKNTLYSTDPNQIKNIFIITKFLTKKFLYVYFSTFIVLPLINNLFIVKDFNKFLKILEKDHFSNKRKLKINEKIWVS